MDSRIKQFDVILFDLGNTLLYFEGDWEQVVAEQNRVLSGCLADMGYNFDIDAFAPYYKKWMDAYFAARDAQTTEIPAENLLRTAITEFGHAIVSEEAIRSALNCSFAVSEAHWKLEADTIPTLAALARQGYRLGLVSNANYGPNVHHLLEMNKLNAYLDTVVVSAEVGIRKPAVRIFEVALNALRVPPTSAVMVGDRLDWDVLGAHNAGLPAVWITRRVAMKAGSSGNDLAGPVRPDATIERLEELPTLLADWKK
jgi:HAD superfamily hydrolase (TIGR01662 family)